MSLLLLCGTHKTPLLCTKKEVTLRSPGSPGGDKTTLVSTKAFPAHLSSTDCWPPTLDHDIPKGSLSFRHLPGGQHSCSLGYPTARTRMKTKQEDATAAGPTANSAVPAFLKFSKIGQLSLMLLLNPGILEIMVRIELRPPFPSFIHPKISH